jgi:glycosyltransferase involved in cell wall biosynthesis
LNEDATLPNWIEVNGAKALGQPLVSIIMPARNAATTITTSIQTIQDEQLQEWEVIVINDGSSDETVEVVDRIRQSDSRIGIYHTCGRGVSFARNLGLSVARGKYIGFLDADDLYEDRAMTKRVKALEDNPDWEGVYCLTEMINDNLEKLNWSIGGYKRKISFADMHNNIHLASVIAKADLLRRQSFQVGLANGEDWLYLSQILRAGTELEYVPDCHVSYRIHDRSTVLQDFTAHENKLLEVIDILYGIDPNCTEPSEQYKSGLIEAPDKQLVILKRRISLLTFLLLSRKARNFYQAIQNTRTLPWESLDEKNIIGSIRSTTMRYYACSKEVWLEKFQQNSSYIQQVIADFKLVKIVPKFCQALSKACL